MAIHQTKATTNNTNGDACAATLYWIAIIILLQNFQIIHPVITVHSQLFSRMQLHLTRHIQILSHMERQCHRKTPVPSLNFLHQIQQYCHGHLCHLLLQAPILVIRKMGTLWVILWYWTNWEWWSIHSIRKFFTIWTWIFYSLAVSHINTNYTYGLQSIYYYEHHD